MLIYRLPIEGSDAGLFQFKPALRVIAGRGIHLGEYRGVSKAARQNSPLAQQLFYKETDVNRKSLVVSHKEQRAGGRHSTQPLAQPPVFAGREKYGAHQPPQNLCHPAHSKYIFNSSFHLEILVKNSKNYGREILPRPISRDQPPTATGFVSLCTEGTTLQNFVLCKKASGLCEILVWVSYLSQAQCFAMVRNQAL